MNVNDDLFACKCIFLCVCSGFIHKIGINLGKMDSGNARSEIQNGMRKPVLLQCSVNTAEGSSEFGAQKTRTDDPEWWLRSSRYAKFPDGRRCPGQRRQPSLVQLAQIEPQEARRARGSRGILGDGSLFGAVILSFIIDRPQSTVNKLTRLYRPDSRILRRYIPRIYPRNFQLQLVRRGSGRGTGTSGEFF